MQSAYGNLKQLIRICSMKRIFIFAFTIYQVYYKLPNYPYPTKSMHLRTFCNTPRARQRVMDYA